MSEQGNPARPDGEPLTVDVWQLISDGIERDGDRIARSHLAAGFPIYTSYADTPPGTVIRENPDGTRELVRFDAAGEHGVGPLPAVEPRT